MKWPRIGFLLIGCLCLPLFSADASAGPEGPEGNDDCGHFLSLKAKGLCLALGGKLELEFVDVEGKGGFENQQGADRTLVDNRSPHLQLDKFVLEPRIFNDHFSLQAELRFEQDRTFVDSVTVTGTPPDIAGRVKSRFEFGLQDPFVKIKRRTESYPLVGRSYWRRSEFHLTYEGSIDWKHLGFFWGGSVAMQRPLEFDDVGEDDGTIHLLQYGQARLIEGVNFTYGGKLGLRAAGLELLYFGFIGGLASRDDMDLLSNELTGYNNLGNRFRKTFYWHGGRLSFNRYNFHLVGEAIASREGELKRWGFYTQASYEFHLFRNKNIPFHTVEPLVRYGQLNLSNLPAVLGDPDTWDHEDITLALLAPIYRDLVKLKAEYSFLRETTGGPQISNNELVIQLEVTF